MNYYDLLKEYATGKGEKVMWITAQRVSDFLKPMKESDPEGYWKLMKETYADMCGKHYNEDFALWQIEQMHFKDKKGDMHRAPHWTKSQYRSVYEIIKARIKNPNYNVWDFAVTLEMLYSDNICMYKEWWADATQDILEQKVIDASVNYLNDDDDPEGKIWKRFNG